MGNRSTSPRTGPSGTTFNRDQDKAPEAIDTRDNFHSEGTDTDALQKKRLLAGSDRSGKRQKLSSEVGIHHPEPRPVRAVSLEQIQDRIQDPSESSLDGSVCKWLESVDSDENTLTQAQAQTETAPRPASEMEYRVDKDGFAVPRTPSPSAPRSGSRPGYSASNISGAQSSYSQNSASSSRSLVEAPGYRLQNLEPNQIFRLPAYEDHFPAPVSELVAHIQRSRDSPEPTVEEVAKDEQLFYMWDGRYAESKVEDILKAKLFPDGSGALEHSSRLPMPRASVPSGGSAAFAGARVSTPAPDRLYGYRRDMAFRNPSQSVYINSMGENITGVNQSFDMVFPFFVIEFKSDGGSMWVATNQCLGAASTCVNISERLNYLLRECQGDKIRQVNSAAFSIAVNHQTAQLYISWKHDELKYYTNSVRNYLLSDPEHYLAFRRHVRNILDWGKDQRLREIQIAIDTIVEEERKAASAQAKMRPPPHEDGDAASAYSGGSGSGTDKRRSSSSGSVTSRGRGRGR